MSSSLISTSVEECTHCAANKISLVKLKKWNFISLCACCALGIGGLTLSLYLYNKHTSLKKSLDDLEAKLELLNEKIDNSKSEKSLQRRSRSKGLNHTSRRSSLRSEGSDSYNTPSTSPTRISKNVEFLLNPNDDDDGYTENSTSQISEEDFLSDNRSLELLHMQSLPDKNLICVNNQAKYEQDPENSKNCIEYIKSLYVVGESELDFELKKIFRMKSYKLAKSHLNSNTRDYLAHKWYAITLGRIIDYMSINEKVKLGFDFKEHLDIAIDMNQSDYLLFYLRGRWAFKICNLTWAERYGVRVIFGKVPNVTIEYALNDFLKVEELHKNKSKGSSLHLAKCYISQGNIESAIKYLNIANGLPTRTSEHLIDNEEIESLLKKYSN